MEQYRFPIKPTHNAPPRSLANNRGFNRYLPRHKHRLISPTTNNLAIHIEINSDHPHKHRNPVSNNIPHIILILIHLKLLTIQHRTEDSSRTDSKQYTGADRRH